MTDEERFSQQSAEFARQRRWMVETQLRRRGIRDERVLAAMAEVPRHEFVPVEARDAAYADGPLSIGFEQTISQPYTVAFMAEALLLAGDEKVLEVGTGSGYAAAVLSRLCREVHTIERIEELALAARDRLARLGYDNVRVYLGDGTMGLPEEAPFDGIEVTAGADQLPPQYADQLADGGRILIPIGATRQGQVMCRFTRSGEQLPCEKLGGFAFVPLIGRYGWDETT
ncbi:MAG: protein-L-isoaspartate(D-aspartate) O-methyltransferase [Pirellulaceae bacterium]